MKPSSLNTWKILCWIKRGKKRALKAPTNKKSWKTLTIWSVFSVPNPEQSVTSKSWCWFPFQAPCTIPRMHCPSCGHLGDPFYESLCSIIYLILVRALLLIFSPPGTQLQIVQTLGLTSGLHFTVAVRGSEGVTLPLGVRELFTPLCWECGIIPGVWMTKVGGSALLGAQLFKPCNLNIPKIGVFIHYPSLAGVRSTVTSAGVSLYPWLVLTKSRPSPMVLLSHTLWSGRE